MTRSERKDRPKTVLLVEDSPGDIRLMQEAFKTADRSVQLQVVPDGLAAMAYLRREGIFANAIRPALILLDLNLPKMDGREVLANIKTDDSLRLIPTIILTTSDSVEDVLYCYECQANSYLCKPVGLELFEKTVESIDNYWLTNAVSLELPR
jgi:chemotaxis family two-component system response regulator Rcp1